MQTYAGDVLKALKSLHDMSSTRISEHLADCGHELRHEFLPECHIPIPTKVQCAPDLKSPALSGIDSAPIDIPFPEEEPESLGAQDSPTVILEGIRKDSLGGCEGSQPYLTPSITVPSHVGAMGYSVLVDIQYPFKKPIGALRFIASPSRQGLRQVVAQILASNDPPNDPGWFIKSLCVRKGNSSYDVLGYPQDDIGSLLDDVLEFEKLIKIECVCSI
ncbi:hypothetical protein PENSUB_1078 [Penicillium subrubescens]|uniref:Uncharacterized protein n=1 Tax=Penicillium subrubescens TaxID=1316194 RepID=A0A1Q5UL85_9EURO|nr:hypothetical protein PENSUB_1078 [Penicillium subrubescens]